MIQCSSLRMTIGDIDRKVEEYVLECDDSPGLSAALSEIHPYVIKYLPARHLATVLSVGQLYASERAGFTWGDAIYVSPVSQPLSTMMYGQVGVVGVYTRAGRRLFDARESRGIDLYQEWIRHQARPYRELTTTVHAGAANRELRNAFRTRFAIDCVFFQPDKLCQSYVDAGIDCWLAITHWDAQHAVGHGFSPAVTGLKWCVITPDTFEPDGRGYRAYLHQSLTGWPSPYAPQAYVHGHYSSLGTDLVTVYTAAVPQVVICDFK